jgi:hypothetical protein
MSITNIIVLRLCVAVSCMRKLCVPVAPIAHILKKSLCNSKREELMCYDTKSLYCHVLESKSNINPTMLGDFLKVAII